MTRVRRPVNSTLFALALAASGSVHAGLIDRGNGLIYDDGLNVTWFQDVTRAHTTGDLLNKRMVWSEAKAWADQLAYRGFTDWRLPNVTPVNGTNFEFNNFLKAPRDGSIDYSYN